METRSISLGMNFVQMRLLGLCTPAGGGKEREGCHEDGVFGTGVHLKPSCFDWA